MEGGNIQVLILMCSGCDRHGIFCKAARYGLDVMGFKPRWGDDIFRLIETRAEDHPAYCAMGTVFPGVQRPGRDAEHPTLLSSESIMLGAIPLPPHCACCHVKGQLDPLFCKVIVFLSVKILSLGK